MRAGELKSSRKVHRRMIIWLHKTYKPNRNLITGIQNLHGTNLISSFDYTNDEIGRRKERIDQALALPSTTNKFVYNIRSEVVEALMGDREHGYEYDPIGNRQWSMLDGVTNSYTANELNQYVEIANGATIEPTYDDDGNMLTHGDWSYTWDGENRLVEASSNGTTVVQNTYDHMSRRVMGTSINSEI